MIGDRFIVVPEAGPLVRAFIDKLNAHVFTPVRRWPPTGQGAARAAERLEAKRAANAEIPDTARITRQQLRRAMRKTHKARALTPAEFARQRMIVHNGRLLGLSKHSLQERTA